MIKNRLFYALTAILFVKNIRYIFTKQQDVNFQNSSSEDIFNFQNINLIESESHQNNLYEDDKLTTRKLQNNDRISQNIRITYDYDLIDNDDSLDEDERNVIREVCETSKLFISLFVKVLSRTSPITMLPTKQLCYDIPYSQKVIYPNKIKDTDIFIQVTSFFNDTTTQVANAIICQFDEFPQIGRISINTASVTEDSMENLGDLYQSIVIHELIHVLGFSRSQFGLWIDPETQKQFSFNYIVKALKQEIINGDKYNLLITKNVQKLFQRHYSCKDLQGMPLELNISSHWSRLAIYNEVMNPFVFSYQSDFTQFTSALLKDTGFYQEINENLIEFSGWGLNQGCKFIKNNCLDKEIEFEEFNYASNNRTFDCDVNGHGKSYLPLRQTNIEGCESFRNEDTQYCTELNMEPAHFTGESFDKQAKCIKSSYKKNTLWNPYFSQYGNTRCFTTVCKQDRTLEIKLHSGQVFNCQYPNQLIKISNKDEEGFINCPTRFEPYCFHKKFCLNNCNYKGFCYNGVCACITGYGGIFCEKQIEDKKVIHLDEIKDSCPEGTYLNLNNVCMTTCPSGFYQKDQICMQCYGRCSQCTGPNKNQCTECTLDYLLISNECIESDVCSGLLEGCRICYKSTCYSCKLGYYLDQNQKCQPCSKNCHECYGNFDFCVSCKKTQLLSENKCLERNNILEGCKILDLNSQSTCNVCKDNYQLKDGICYLCQSKQYYSFEENICKECDSSCAECSYSPDHCIKCSNGYSLNEDTFSCIPVPQDSKVYTHSLNKIEERELLQQNCHRTCDKCFDGLYTSCTQCKENRLMVSLSQEYKSICVCPYQSTDQVLGPCSYNYLGDQLIYYVTVLHALAIVNQLFQIIVMKQSLFKLVVLVQTYQFTSYLRFINFYFPLEADRILRQLQMYNIFNYQAILYDFQADSQAYINPKFLNDDKTPYFFANNIVLILILVALNLFMVSSKYLSFLKKFISQLVMTEITLFLNFFSLQELVLNLFVGIQLFNIDESSKAQLVMGFLFVLIFIVYSYKIAVQLQGYSKNSTISFDQQNVADSPKEEVIQNEKNSKIIYQTNIYQQKTQKKLISFLIIF